MTRREEIIEILSKEEKSAQDLANEFKVELFEILEDLKHIKYSRKLLQRPAQCKKCSFIFKERSKVKKPSKCPRCKSEWIMAPLFKVE